MFLIRHREVAQRTLSLMDRVYNSVCLIAIVVNNVSGSRVVMDKGLPARDKSTAASRRRRHEITADS